MMRLLRRILGHGSRHVETVSRAKRTNEMLTKLNGRQRDIERQTQRIRRTGDPISNIYAGQPSQDKERS